MNLMSWIGNTNTDAASYIICADGGANRLFDMPEDNETESKQVSDLSMDFAICVILLGYNLRPKYFTTKIKLTRDIAS